jgi:predicted phosphodiesterase
LSTLVVSDLHLGTRSGADLLRLPGIADVLVERLARPDVDRLILLGDILELREGPIGEALAVARPLCERIGEALDGRPVVLVPGNHDHALLAGWAGARGRDQDDGPLGPEQWIAPADASPAAAALAAWLEPAQVEVAYPGLWLADGVYATHGHYLDAHMTVPAFESIAWRAAMKRLRKRGLTGVDLYEAAFGPISAPLVARAQHAPAGRVPRGIGVSIKVYGALTSDGGGSPKLGHRYARRVAWPATIAAINALGLGPVSSELSGGALRRAGLRAMGDALAAMGVTADTVIFGHTHRAGPLAADESTEWRNRGRGTLMNCGVWTWDSVFVAGTSPANPYWPGTVAVVEGAGPPRLERLLADRDEAWIAEQLGAATAGITQDPAPRV